jgi:Flp pilus assembly protein TadD
VSLRARHEEAARELRSVLPLLTRDVDRYYAQLFLGADENALGRLDAARSAYQQAASLFPRAQSPWLALSQLAWQQGDSVAARTAFLALADLPSSAAERDDPWWDYDIAPAADAEQLLNNVRALAAREKEKLR